MKESACLLCRLEEHISSFLPWRNGGASGGVARQEEGGTDRVGACGYQLSICRSMSGGTSRPLLEEEHSSHPSSLPPSVLSTCCILESQAWKPGHMSERSTKNSDRFLYPRKRPLTAAVTLRSPP